MAPTRPGSISDVFGARPVAKRAGEILPFSVIDQVVHLLETPAEPWTIQFEVAIPGHFDEGRLRDALRLAVAEHPMARARKLPSSLADRTWRWQISPTIDVNPLRIIDCADAAALAAVRAEFYSRRVPLAESPPFRLVLARQATGDVLLLSANHAAFDGLGCLRLVQAIARTYRGDPDPTQAVGLHVARDVRSRTSTGGIAERLRRLRMLGSMAANLVRQPTRLAPEGGTPRPGYGFHTVLLTTAETDLLVCCPTSTVNELLLTALTLAIETWNDQHNVKSGNIAIMVPVNLRPKSWAHDVVTNLVLNAQVCTKPRARADRGSVARAIAAQNQRIRTGAGPALTYLIGTWTWVPRWAKQPASWLPRLSGNRLQPTAVLSNLGSLTDLPDFGPGAGLVCGVWFSPPALMPGGLAIGATTVQNRLNLSFRYRHPLLGADEASRFSQEFLAQLRVL